ncbi:uncharacterized protein [Danio rerio]|uniref:Uncharacterized protein n=1 Tax=Danio rerio TaxID=7955 RepID=A0AC58GL20_DANRE|nr:uncharacterized protein LOC101886896 [Danio rerio]|eukprot:XP_005172662.3 uncharacterized protein LOC101886896 [Danio rerio]
MKQSCEASRSLSTRPKRQQRLPRYLEDYEVGPIRQQTHVSPHFSVIQHMHGLEGWSSQQGGAATEMAHSPMPRQVQWESDVSEYDNYSPGGSLCSNEPYTEWADTLISHRQERSVQYNVQTESTLPYRHIEAMPSSYAQHWSNQKGERSLATSAQISEQWPMPPPPVQPDFPAQPEVEEYDNWAPPPPWPSAEVLAPPEREEKDMVAIIDKMMNDLQLMKESAASRLTSKGHLASTPMRTEPLHFRKASQPNAIQSQPRRSHHYSPVAGSPHVIDHFEPAIPPRHSARPHVVQRASSQYLPYQSSSVRFEEKEYRGPAPKIPFFIHRDPMEFSRLKLALTNLLPAESSELFKYQVLVDHLRLEEACLIADSYINSPMPFSDTMAALNEKFGQPHHVALKKIAAVMDSPEIKRGDTAAFERFALHVQSLVGMLKTLGPEGEAELRCGSHVARLLTKLPTELRANFRRQMFHRSGSTHTLLDLAEWLHYESWCQGYDVSSNTRVQGLLSYKAEKRHSKPAASVLHGAEGSMESKGMRRESQSAFETKGRGKMRPYCPYCDSSEHFLNKCPAIQKLNREDVINWIKANKRCWRCGRSHQAAQCDLKRLCDLCQGKHLRVLHQVNTRPTAEPPKEESCLVNTNAEILYLDRPSASNRVLLKVVRVFLRNKDRTLDTYAVLDDGSERTMLLPEAADQLGLQGKQEDLILRTIRQDVQTLEGSTVSFCISSSAYPRKGFRIRDAFTSQRLSLADHTYPISMLKKKYKHLAGLPIEPFEHVKPLLLIGADHPHLLSPVEPVRLGPPGGPSAICTRLGWTLQGPTHLIPWTTTSRQCLLTSVLPQTTELMRNVEKLWQLDVLPFQQDKLVVRSKQDNEAVELLETKTKRVEVSGILRYATPLLRKKDMPLFQATKEVVLPSLRSTEKRLAKDTQRANAYSEAIHQLVKTGAVRKLDPGEISADGESWYIPHHLVSHNGKNRLVFNCSYQFRGMNLNDALLPGPTLGASLLGVLLRFREHGVAVSGDIKAMFHQVQLLPEDRALLRFVWRDRREDPPDTFEWQVLPFGTTCSPCCATYALHRHVRDCSDPEDGVKDSVERCFYVDNCLQSLPTAAEAKRLVDRLREVLSFGGFEIRQWACNVPSAISHLPKDARSDSMERWLSHDENGLSESTLGLSWHWESDTLGYKSRPLDYGVLTMRNVYRVLARQYDPLGFVLPYTTRAKLLVQSMWDKHRNWDDPLLPHELQQAWKEWEAELHLLPHLSLPRSYVPAQVDQAIVSRQVHIFSDASEKAYGSVSYMRTEDVKGQVYLSFLAARSRVAPRRQHSIPRLELCGALTAAQLAKMLERELTLKIDEIILWSDSTTVLAWLQSESCRFKVFVGTRVAEIQELTNPDSWHYVDSSLNPADDLTRGKTLEELALPNRWSHGPSFLLKGPHHWPSQPTKLADPDMSECRKSVFCGIISNPDWPSSVQNSQYTTWKDLVEAVAHELHGAADSSNPIVASEYQQAELVIYKKIQQDCFQEELHCLKKGKPVAHSSRLLTLSPELDSEEGIMRVGGRLRRAETLDPGSKHPIVLDPSHPFTKLLMEDYDSRLCHPGPERVYAEIRRRFWILRGRQAIRHMQHQCKECRRWKAKPSVPKMSDLPEARLRLYKPAFYSTGVDCFGPFQIKLGRRSEKRWGIIYKCLTTRAVHLDLIHRMDSDSFLMSLRRFIARRGTPAELYSDQGTNFKAGEKELRESFDSMAAELQQLLAKQKIAFHFNPPAAPHFGGAWEREIRSVKSALYTIIGAQSISDEVLHTVLLEVEAILNAKPLGYTSSNVADVDAITPNVLLMGRPDGALPQIVYNKSEGLSKRRWKHCQVLADHFWSRFIKSYLPTMQQRQKWHTDTADLTVNSVVLLMDPQLPRALWPIGKVIKVHLSADQHVRSVDVQIKDKIYTRPVARLIVLPALPESDGESAPLS